MDPYRHAAGQAKKHRKERKRGGEDDDVIVLGSEEEEDCKPARGAAPVLPRARLPLSMR